MKPDYRDMLLGKYLGRGRFREVYVCGIDESLVVKVARDRDGCLHNGMEWEHYWDLHEIEKVKPWLCPVERITDDHSILLMKRAETIQKHQLPKKVPKFVTDLKPENLGWYEGRPVVIDYAYILYDVKTKMKKAVY